jgi:hypothetical protein
MNETIGRQEREMTADGINGGSRLSRATGMCYLLFIIIFYYYNYIMCI